MGWWGSEGGPLPCHPPVVLQTASSRSDGPLGVLEWPSEGTDDAPTQRKYSARMGCSLTGCSIGTKLETSIWFCIPSRKTNGSGKQEVETEIALLTVAHSVLLGNFVQACVPAPLSSAALVVLAPKWV